MGGRSHFGQGILEFYAEWLDIPLDSNLVGFMKLLARKNHPKGHEICPCGSGQRLRNCHRDLVYANRLKLPWLAVQKDLEVLNKGIKV